MTAAELADRMHRQEADYDVRLTARVAEWERKNPTPAAQLRLETQRKIGMTAPPPVNSMRWMALERAYREEVRKLHPRWPSLDQFMRGDN